MKLLILGFWSILIALYVVRWWGTPFVLGMTDAVEFVFLWQPLEELAYTNANVPRDMGRIVGFVGSGFTVIASLFGSVLAWRTSGNDDADSDLS